MQNVSCRRCTTALRAIRTATYTVGSVVVTCRLYQCEGGSPSRETEGYAIGMRACGQSYLYFLGWDARRAQRIYELMVSAAVSPCTLRDVLEDLTTAGTALL